MTLELVPSVKVDGTYLVTCAERIRTEYDRSRAALSDAVDAYFAIGHALLDARRAHSSDQAFGLWFREQDFGFSQQWAHLLRQAAEMEPEVRAVVTTQVVTGKPNIKTAVRAARAALNQKESASMTDSAVATVTPIAGRRSFSEQVEYVRSLVTLGMDADRIAAEMGVSKGHVHNIASAGGIPLGKKSRVAIAQRIDRMRELAKEGATSIQISDELGVGITVISRYARDHHIEIPADATTHPYRAIDSTRIISTTIDTIDGIGVMFDHIDYSTLATEDIDGWVSVLNESIRSLTNLRKQLKELTQP